MFETILVKSWWRSDGPETESIPGVAIVQGKRVIWPIGILWGIHCQQWTVWCQQRVDKWILHMTIRTRWQRSCAGWRLTGMRPDGVFPRWYSPCGAEVILLLWDEGVMACARCLCPLLLVVMVTKFVVLVCGRLSDDGFWSVLWTLINGLFVLLLRCCGLLLWLWLCCLWNMVAMTWRSFTTII